MAALDFAALTGVPEVPEVELLVALVFVVVVVVVAADAVVAGFTPLALFHA